MVPTTIEGIEFYELQSSSYPTIILMWANEEAEFEPVDAGRTGEFKHYVRIDTMALMEEVFFFPSPIEARLLRLYIYIGTVRKDSCFRFELIGCPRSGVKFIEPRPLDTKIWFDAWNKFFDYLFDNPKYGYRNKIIDPGHCLYTNMTDFNDTYLIYLDATEAEEETNVCIYHELSPTYSYGVNIPVSQNEKVGIAVSIADVKMRHRVTSNLYTNFSVSDITTTVTEPGIIMSHDFPFHYRSGQLWCWDIKFDSEQTISMIFYNASFNKNQVQDQKGLFVDKIDRLYVTYEDFDSKWLFSDKVIDSVDGIIAVLDLTNNDPIRHLLSNEYRVRLYWRTVVAEVPKDQTAAGFRAIIYPSEATYCIQAAICTHKSAHLIARSITGEYVYASQPDTWIIKAERHTYIALFFYKFDIGCKSGSKLVITSKAQRKPYCNTNRPMDNIQSNDELTTVMFMFEKQSSTTIMREGFEAVYETKHGKQIRPELLSTKQTEFIQISPSTITPSLKVCSDTFGKCYLLLDEIHLLTNESASWSFSEAFCERQNSTLVTFHSQEEQDFIGYILLHHLNHTNNAHAYIGLQGSVSVYPPFKWRDGSPVTFMAWSKGEPSPDLGLYCVTMALSWSEDITWKSITCEEASATVAVCQYSWMENLPNKTNQTRDKTNNLPNSEDEYLSTHLSVFHCDNSEVINLLGLCDGHPDCLDGSDEVHCTVTTDGCTNTQFRCGDGTCVSLSVLCDFSPDCKDLSDEDCFFPPCRSSEFQCGNNRCIPAHQRCDGKPDCDNDEENCVDSNCNRGNSFACSSTKCISREFVCDGVADCIKGIDEQDCKLPDSCQEWWNAGYHDTGFYNIGGGAKVRCNFSDDWISAQKVKITYFDFDYERKFSIIESSRFEYAQEQVLIKLINSSECYQTVEQRCHPWIERLYDMDYRIPKNLSSPDWSWYSVHICFCMRYTVHLRPNVSTSADNRDIQDCFGNSMPLLPGDAFRIKLELDETYGYVYSMKLMPTSSFDDSLVSININPVEFLADFQPGPDVISCAHGIATADMETKCLYRLDIFGQVIGCRTLEHLQGCESFECPVEYFKCPGSFCIERRLVCDGIPQCQNEEDEHYCDEYLCAKQYRCLQSNICLPRRFLCDGFPQCPSKDDERLCDFRCPANCRCTGYTVDCSHNSFNTTMTLSAATRMFDVSYSPTALTSFEFNETDVQYLVHFNLSSCRIQNLSNISFEFMVNLKFIDLSKNDLNNLPPDKFINQQRLKVLTLSDNLKLLNIETDAFIGLTSLQKLILTDLTIKSIATKAFAFVTANTVDLSRNAIYQIEDKAFETLKVQNLFLNTTDITIFSDGLFEGIDQLSFLVTKAYKYCCLKPYFLPEENCLPHQDEFSSCDDLMRNQVLRSLIWIIGLLALVGNALSLIYRLTVDKKRLRLGYGIFVSNLAVSDFLMGVYLIIIASADMHYKGEYILHDESWRNSGLCTFAGVLATLSSETSVLFICLITVDRILVIKFPFGDYRLTPKPSGILTVLVWVLSIVIAVIPLIFTSYFQGEFYSKSGVCLALPLTRDRPSGWMYSVILFIGFNFITFLLIGTGQLLIFAEVRSAKMPAGKSAANRNKDLKVARNLLFVVLTDFLCWFPIGIFGCLALSGTVIPADVYAWTAVFVLPVNSALNPCLYTLTAIVGNKSVVPDENEHVKTFTFEKRQVDEIFNIWRKWFYFRERPNAFVPLSMYHKSNPLHIYQSMLVAKGILRCIHGLHMRGLKQKELLMRDIFVKPPGLKVALNCNPELATKQKEKSENIKSFGLIFGNLLDTCKTRRDC